MAVAHHLAALLAAIAEEAQGVRLHFLQKPDKDSAPLRDGRVDLETGVIEASLGPEVRSQARWIASAALGEDPASVEKVKPWRRGFVFPWRADALGEAIARADFEHYGAEPWAADVWDEDGRLRPADEIDARSLRRHRDDWRAAVGLPTDPALWAEADVAARVFPKEVPEQARTQPGWVVA